METVKTGREIFVGILACNHKDKTLKCVKSVLEAGQPEQDILVIDNGSRENIAEKVSESFPRVPYLVSKNNTGAAAGRNLLIDYFIRSGEWSYLAFLDNDIRLLPDTLDCLVQEAEHQIAAGVKLGALGAHVVYHSSPDTLWSAGGALIDWSQADFESSGQGLSRNTAFPAPRPLDTIPTACILATRNAVKATGNFEEDFFIYLEDSDWCWRMKRAGFELWSAPSAIAEHDVSSSLGTCTAEFYYYRTRNRLWFFRKYANNSRFRMLVRAVWHIAWHSCYPELRAGNFRQVRWIVAGIFQGLTARLSCGNMNNSSKDNLH